MKEIPLTRGMVALVDDEDFEWLSRWKWRCCNCSGGEVKKIYAITNNNSATKRSTVRMHRLIFGTTDLFVDHIDGNGLNNQRSNLRPCTNGQNMMNQSKAHRFYLFKGVGFHKRNKRWHAAIKKDKKSIHLGYFDFSVDAAIAYNEAAKRLFGEFASLNIIPE